MRLKDIRTDFKSAANPNVSRDKTSAQKTHTVSRGGLEGSTKQWINKEMREPAVARREFLAQEFFRVIIPHQPETRLLMNGATGTHHILSEEVKGYQDLPLNQAEKFENGTFTGLGQVLVVSLFLQEIDLKNGNLGLDHQNQVIKIGGDWCFAQFRESEIKQYGITADTIKSLPYPKGFHTFNWLDYTFAGAKYASSDIVSPGLVNNPQFRAEVNQAMLKFV